jgi:uncharacterized protein involved in exopolysaccharide biosynthesis
LLSFDPASISSAILEVDDHQPQPNSVASQLLSIKGLLSIPIDALVQDSDGVRQILEEIRLQLTKDLQIKLWPTGHLPLFRAKVEKARQRIEAHRSQAPLKADIAERCQLLNKKKAALDTKTDTSAHSQRLHLLEKELEDLKAKVRATEQRIQEEKNLIASSKQEAEDLTAQLKTKLDEAVIAEADHVRLEVIAAIDEFLQ